MHIVEIGTGYTSIPAKMGAATEIVAEELTKSFLSSGHRVTLADIRDPSRLPCGLPILEVPVPACLTGTDPSLGLCHKYKRVLYSIALTRRLQRMIRQSAEPLLLHFHNQYNLFFFLKLTPKRMRRKVTTAYTVHSHIWHGSWEAIEKTVGKRYFQEVFCLKAADYAFVLNKITKENILDHVLRDGRRLSLIGNGVNTEIYHPFDPVQRNAVKKSLGLQDKHVFLQVGSVCPRKNQLEALACLLPLMQEDTSIVYAYAGGILSAEYQQKIQAFSRANHMEDRVLYLGEVPPGQSLNAYYNIADALLCPSTSEGFPLVILEAMAAAVPVIVRSTLRFPLEAQCLAYTTEREFAGVIREEILDPVRLRHHREQARKVILESYCWDKIAKDYLNIWEHSGKEERQ